jgi:hypothetical protein
MKVREMPVSKEEGMRTDTPQDYKEHSQRGGKPDQEADRVTGKRAPLVERWEDMATGYQPRAEQLLLCSLPMRKNRRLGPDSL